MFLLRTKKVPVEITEMTFKDFDDFYSFDYLSCTMVCFSACEMKQNLELDGAASHCV